MSKANEAIQNKDNREESPVDLKKKQDERDQLVKQYMPFAMYIVRKVSKTVSGNVDFDDLLGYAKVGLLEAAERFDARYKVDFRTFAFYRIRGAIYDGLRTTGWLSRSQFAKHQFEEASNNYLKNMSDRNAAGGNRYSNSNQDMANCILNLASVYIMSLDAAEGLQVRDTTKISAEAKCELGQTRERVRKAIENLPEKEKQLIKLYYYGGMTLDEAGESLGLSRSWTSRLHARALEQLQKIIKETSEQAELDSFSSVAREKKSKEVTKKKTKAKSKKSKTVSKNTSVKSKIQDQGNVNITRC